MAKRSSASGAVSLEDQFKHILYDMLLLAMAIRYLRQNWPAAASNAVFGPKEVAKGLALVKIRSLDCFLHDIGRKDDICLDDFKNAGFASSPAGITLPLSFRVSVNKYAAHLTKDRTIQDAKRPKADDVIRYGRQILDTCHMFAAECQSNGLVVRGQAKKYLLAFEDEFRKI